MSYFPPELHGLDTSGDITSWRTIRRAPENPRLLEKAWERFECALFYGWNALLVVTENRLPTAELGGVPLFPLVKMEQILDWTVGAHLDAYSGIYDAAEADYYYHGVHREYWRSPLAVVAYDPMPDEEADSMILYHYRKLRAQRVHTAAPILECLEEHPREIGWGAKCSWYFKSLDRAQMEGTINRDRHLKTHPQARDRLRRGINVFQYVVKEGTFPDVMGSMLSLMADYLHESEEHIRNSIKMRKTRSNHTYRDGFSS